MICACPCQQEFQRGRSNQIYLNAEHRERDKNRRWPVKRQSVLPVALRNGLGNRQEAKTSGVTPLRGTESPPGGKKAMRTGVELRLAQLGLLAKVQFRDFSLPESDLLTGLEVSRFLRVSRWTLCAWRRAGQGPPFVKLTRNKIFYLRGRLGLWLQARIGGKA